MFTYVNYALIFGCCLIVLLCAPAFWRLLRNRSRVFDSLKTCCLLLSLAFFNSFFTFQGTWFTPGFTPWRTVSAVVTGVTFVTLLVVLWKTDKALGKS